MKIKVTKVSNKEISQCYYQCPYFHNEHEMECMHPLFHNKDSDNYNIYAGLIITLENSRGRFPDECPLLKEKGEMTNENKSN